MKNIYKILSGFFLLAGLLYMSSCEESVVLDYTEYSPAVPDTFSYAKKEFYPQRNILASDTPVFSVEGVFMLKVDSVHAASSGDYIKSKFKIDAASGVITYNNIGGTLNPGDYALDVSIHTVNSIVHMVKAYSFTVLDIPVMEYTGEEFHDGTVSYYKDQASASKFAYKKNDKFGEYITAYHAPGAIFNSWIIAKVDITPDWNGNKLFVSFDEKNGWGPAQNAVYAETARHLQYSYDQISWTDVMLPDNPDWPVSGSGKYVSVPSQEIDGIDTTQSAIYFKWHYDNSASDTKTKSAWFLDNLTFMYTVDQQVVEE